MPQAEFCMFCYYRNKRIAACRHGAAPEKQCEPVADAKPAKAPHQRSRSLAANDRQANRPC